MTDNDLGDKIADSIVVPLSVVLLLTKTLVEKGVLSPEEADVVEEPLNRFLAAQGCTLKRRSGPDPAQGKTGA